MGIRPNLRFGVALLATSGLVLALAAPAGAKTMRTGYEPTGWSSSVTHGGLCLQTLTCPSASTAVGKSKSNRPVLHASLGSLTGVGATTTVTWTSNAFTYHGAEGKRAPDVKFVMRRRADTGDLLAVAGNSATYSANVISAKTGNSVAEAVHHENLAPTAGYTRVGPRQAVRALRRGHTYRIQVTAEFTNGAEVIPGASVDFKRARVVARRYSHH